MYTIFVKGWGEDEDFYFAVAKGDSVDKLVSETFKEFEFEAEYYVMHNDTLDTVAEGLVNEGVY
jgi:hypothetical protein